MITTTLKDQLDMVWRTENPDYIIILKNKAGKDMDFKNFIIVDAEEQPEPKIKQIKDAKFIISYDPALKTESLFSNVRGAIVVKDNEREVYVFSVITRPSRFKEYIAKLKREYRGYILQELAS